MERPPRQKISEVSVDISGNAQNCPEVYDIMSIATECACAYRHQSGTDDNMYIQPIGGYIEKVIK